MNLEDYLLKLEGLNSKSIIVQKLDSFEGYDYNYDGTKLVLIPKVYTSFDSLFKDFSLGNYFYKVSKYDFYTHEDCIEEKVFIFNKPDNDYFLSLETELNALNKALVVNRVTHDFTQEFYNMDKLKRKESLSRISFLESEIFGEINIDDFYTLTIADKI